MSDFELRAWLSVTRRLPRVRGAGIVSNYARRIYLRRRRGPVSSRFLGYELTLDPHENVEGEMCFHPQLCDHRELAFLRAHLRPGDVFIDVGANVGAYSFAAHERIGPTGRIIALEADPFTHAKLSRNIEQNRITNIVALNVGAAGERGTLRLWLNTSGNRGGNTFIPDARRDNSVEVQCEPLYDILVGQGVERIDAMKLDIEGFEYAVLNAFFQRAPVALHPSMIIMEFKPELVEIVGGSALEVVERHGYVQRLRVRENHILLKER